MWARLAMRTLAHPAARRLGSRGVRPVLLRPFRAAAAGGAAVSERQRLTGQFLDLAQERPFAVVAEEVARPEAPARAVRPMRWT